MWHCVVIVYYSLCHWLVVHIGKYLLKKGKVCENNKCHKAHVILAELFF